MGAREFYYIFIRYIKINVLVADWYGLDYNEDYNKNLVTVAKTEEQFKNYVKQLPALPFEKHDFFEQKLRSETQVLHKMLRL